MNFKGRWRFKVPLGTTFHTANGEVDYLAWIRQSAKASNGEVFLLPIQAGANVVYVFIAEEQDAHRFRVAVPQEFAELIKAANIGPGPRIDA
jgi:hypothetical protein